MHDSAGRGTDAIINIMLLKCAVFLYYVIIYRLNSNVINAELCFPNDFLFGVATAAYQIEGAWNVSGKGESIWDRYTHEHPERVFDHTNGDIADGSYYKFKDDVQLMKRLGVGVYRFSMSWPRILPTGLTNYVNEDGIRYYRELLTLLQKNDIIPIVTMYHWDLPQSLQDLGGWTNPIMAEYFLDYAKLVLEKFSDQVKIWLTFNEPLSFCHDGYGGNDAPGGRSSGLEAYMCGHNVLRAHGMVYRMYSSHYRKSLEGGMGIALNIPWMVPASNSSDDQVAAETARQFMFGWFAHPIFSDTGDYPKVMRKQIDANSKHQGFRRSRLPNFTTEEIKMIRGSYDFMGLNHYTTYAVNSGNSKVNPQPSFENDANVEVYQKNEWPRTNSTWLRVVPWGFRQALNWIKKTYNNPLIWITENGVSLEPGIQDIRRIKYIDSYLRSLYDAIMQDGCQVVGYTYWSLMDNFEWMRGYSERFGLCQVDYKSPNLTRTPRMSFDYYRYVATTGCLPNAFGYHSYTTV